MPGCAVPRAIRSRRQLLVNDERPNVAHLVASSNGVGPPWKRSPSAGSEHSHPHRPPAARRARVLSGRRRQLRWEQPIDLGLQGQRCNVTLLIDSGQVVVGFATHVLAYALEDGTPQWRHDIREATNATSPVALALPGLAVQADGRD